MHRLLSMSAPVAVQLADPSVSAATGNPGLRKGGGKAELSAAQSQAFSNLLLAAQQKGSAGGTLQSPVGKQAQDAAVVVKASSAAVSAPVSAAANSAAVQTALIPPYIP